MCGLIGTLRTGPHRLDDDHRSLVRSRDRMTHRGPDDAGDWSDRTAWIGHRRLAIMDPEHGQASFVIDTRADGPCVVAFNGELLNHAELRDALAAERRSSDPTATERPPPSALAHWGDACSPSVPRPVRRRVVLAPTPVAAPRPRPLRRGAALLPSGRGRRVLRERTPRARRTRRRADPPDPAVVSAYLSTIRITLGERTLIDGHRTVLPGQLVSCDQTGPAPRVERRRWWTPATPTGELSGEAADRAIREAIAESLEAHLQSDVEVCALLSGGVDSAILTALAADRLPEIRTFTAIGGDGRSDPDRTAATLMARHLGVAQTEIDVDRTAERPLARWRRMVGALGVPLGTPNEIAINALAEGVANAGVKVAIGGEGADELLGGYEPVLRIVAGVAAVVDAPLDAAVAILGAASWLAPGQKPAAIAGPWLEAIEGDRLLFEETAASIDAGGPASDPRSYLRWLQEVNLTGLLGRLNHATMLASVECGHPTPTGGWRTSSLESRPRYSSGSRPPPSASRRPRPR